MVWDRVAVVEVPAGVLVLRPPASSSSWAACSCSSGWAASWACFCCRWARRLWGPCGAGLVARSLPTPPARGSRLLAAATSLASSAVLFFFQVLFCVVHYLIFLFLHFLYGCTGCVVGCLFVVEHFLVWGWGDRRRRCWRVSAAGRTCPPWSRWCWLTSRRCSSSGALLGGVRWALAAPPRGARVLVGRLRPLRLVALGLPSFRLRLPFRLLRALGVRGVVVGCHVRLLLFVS